MPIIVTAASAGGTSSNPRDSFTADKGKALALSGPGQYVVPAGKTFYVVACSGNGPLNFTPSGGVIQTSLYPYGGSYSCKTPPIQVESGQVSFALPGAPQGANAFGSTNLMQSHVEFPTDYLVSFSAGTLLGVISTTAVYAMGYLV